MGLITLEEAKQYLRVDSADEDELMKFLSNTAQALVFEVARLNEDEVAFLQGTASDGENITLTEEDRAMLKMAAYFTLGYLYEHREEADHHSLVITLRNLLFSIREGRGDA